MMTGKIHRATITQADLNYVGSITIDSELLDAANILENEKVSVVNVTSGTRLETYALAGPRGEGQICINGAAAHLVNPGDLVIIIAYGQLNETEVASYTPRVVHVDRLNRIVGTGHDAGETIPGDPTLKSSR